VLKVFAIYQYMAVFHLSWEQAVETPFSRIRQLLQFQAISNELNNQTGG
jgi:hypothetical protein